MPYDPSGNFTRDYDWTTDRNNGVKVRADRMDGEFNNFATAMNQVILRNGAAAFTGNVQMGGNSIVSLADGSVGTPAIRFLGSPTSGLYSPGLDRVALTASGTNRVEAHATGVTLTGATAINGATTVTGNLGVTGTFTHTGTFNVAGSLNFPTSPGLVQVGGVNVLRMTSGADVAIGDTFGNPAATLDVQRAGTTTASIQARNSVVTVGMYVNPTDAYIGTAAAHPFNIYTNSVVRASISSTGAATFNSTLGVTGAATVGGTLGVTGNISTAGSVTGSDFRQAGVGYFTYDTGGTGTGAAVFRNGGGAEALRMTWGGNIGINTSSVPAKLTVLTSGSMPSDLDGNVGAVVIGPNQTTTSNQGNLAVMSNSTATVGHGGSIALGGLYTGTTAATFARIAGVGAGSYTGALTFATRDGGALMTEAMRITPTGSVGIGTTTPNRTGASRAVTLNGASSSVLEFLQGDVLNAYIYNTASALQIDAGTSTLSIVTGYVPRFTLNPAGAAAFSGTLSVAGNTTITGGIGIGGATPDSLWGAIVRARNTAYAGLFQNISATRNIGLYPGGDGDTVNAIYSGGSLPLALSARGNGADFVLATNGDANFGSSLGVAVDMYVGNGSQATATQFTRAAGTAVHLGVITGLEVSRLQTTAAATTLRTSTASPISLGTNSTDRLSITAAGETYFTAAQAPTQARAVGYLGIPQVGGAAKTSNYTAVLADAGQHILMNGTALTATIPSNAAVAYPVGTTLSFANINASALSISINTDTMVLAGTVGTVGTRSLAVHGVATALKVTSTSWLISGPGLT